MNVPQSPETPGRPLPSFAPQEATENISEILHALDSYKKKDPAKGVFCLQTLTLAYLNVRISSVVVRFKAVGNAPIMKQNFYKITASNRFQAVIQFLRKELAWKPGDPLVSITHVAQLCCRH
jgi:ubiquitin-like protein ATG12